MKQKFARSASTRSAARPRRRSAAIAADIPKWAKVIKDANIKTGQLSMDLSRASPQLSTANAALQRRARLGRIFPSRCGGTEAVHRAGR
jgi:hypothetical protein